MDKKDINNIIKNKETHWETVRLSLMIPVFACIELFVAAVFSVPLVFDKNWIVLAILAAIAVLPDLAALILYANYRVLFDKEHIVYRDLLRRSRCCELTDIWNVREKGGFFSELITAEGTILVANADRNGRELMALAVGNKAPKLKKRSEKTKIPLDAKLDVIVGILGALFFYLLLYIMPVDDVGRTLEHCFWLFVFFSLSCTVYGAVWIYEIKKMTRDEYGRYGSYLIHRKGNIVSGYHDKTLWCGLFFLVLGFVLNGLTNWFYAAGIVFLLIFAFRECRVLFLYRCSEPTVRRMLADHRPSPHLEAKLPEHLQKYIDPAIVLKSTHWDLEEEVEKEKLKDWTDPPDTESSLIFFGKIVTAAALVSAVIATCILCNYILYDARPDHAVEFDSVLTYSESPKADKEEEICLYIVDRERVNNIHGANKTVMYIPVFYLDEDDQKWLDQGIENK